MKRVVVLGATGNIGGYLTLHLKECGYEVIACGKRASDNGFFAQYGIPYHSVDICDAASFDVLPAEGVDAVVHLAGELPSRYAYDPSMLIQSITIGTMNVLEYVRRAGVETILFPQTPFDIWYKHNTAESIGADDVRSFPLTGDHAVYTIAKNAAVDLIEHYHATYGLRRFILRFFTIYEFHPNPYHYGDGVRKKMPYRILMDKAARGEDIEIWGDPARTKEIVYVKDFCHLADLCLRSEREGGIYNVGGRCISLDEQIRGIVEVFSPKDHPSKLVYRPDRPDALLASFDTSKTERELGYRPQYTYLEAMRDFKEEMEKNRFERLWGPKVE